MADDLKMSRFDVLQWAQAALDLADIEARALGKPAPIYAHVSVTYEQLKAIAEAVGVFVSVASDKVFVVDVRGCKFMAWNPAYHMEVTSDEE